MLSLPITQKSGSKTFNLLFLAAVALVMLHGSATRLFGQATPLITEFGTSSGGIAPYGLAVADFNGDGIPDVVVINSYNDSGAIAVYLGNGDGTFKPPIFYLPNVSSRVAPTIVAADFNGDGKVDLCFADVFDAKIWVMLGNGDGTFRSPVSSPLVGSGAPIPQPVWIAVGDFNGDGKLDVVVSAQGIANASNPYPMLNGVLLLLGNGDGTFASSTVALSDYSSFGQIVTAHFKGDTNLDLAVLSNDGIYVAFGNGAGVFTTYDTISPPEYENPGAMVVADFNGDGYPDLAVVTPGSVNASEVFVFLGDDSPLAFGSGYLSTTLTGNSAGQPGTMVAADFNGDGHIDLVIGNQEPPLVSLLQGNGDGTFQLPTSPGAQFPNGPATVVGMAAADLNGDLKPDIALVTTGSNSLTSILNTPGTVGAAIFPINFDFGAQVVGATPATTTITIGNPGTSAMQFSSLAVSDTTDFSVTTTCGSTVAPQAGCTISITFNPQATGAKSASVTFTTNDPLASTGKISITGSAIAPGASTSPAELQFSYQKVGTTSAPQTLQITDGGVGPLTLSAISIQGDFQQTNNCPASLAQGASCTVTITYSPLVPGSEVGRLLIMSNAVPPQSAVALTGIGYVVGPMISVSPSSFDFGSQYVGTSSAPSVVTVENTGDAPFTISSVAATAGFVPLSTCGNLVQPSFSCAIGIFFDPATTGSQTGTLTITDNLSSSPQTVALTGNGTAITVGASGDSSSAQTFSSGKAAYQMSIAPVAGFSGTVNLSCVGLAAGYTCALSQPSAVLNGSASASVTVSVTASTTTAAGTHGTPGSEAFGRIALACPIALIFLGAGIYPRWRRRFLAMGLLVVAAAFTSSCGSTSGTVGGGSSQTYVFFLQAQPASGITIETPLTLTVPNQ